MNSTDLENLYIKIDGRISLVAGFTEDLDLIKIIKGCRLKPYSIFTETFTPGTKFEPHWVDEFGNSLKFDGKIPRIQLNSIISENTKISTDLFFGNSIRTTAKNSKLAFIASGVHFDKDIHIVALYGQDEYLRVFIHNKKWSRISPLLLGMNTLHMLYNSMNSILITEMDKRKLDILLHFDVDKCAMTSLPARRDIISRFNNEIITSIF